MFNVGGVLANSCGRVSANSCSGVKQDDQGKVAMVPTHRWDVFLPTIFKIPEALSSGACATNTSRERERDFTQEDATARRPKKKDASLGRTQRAPVIQSSKPPAPLSASEDTLTVRRSTRDRDSCTPTRKGDQRRLRVDPRMPCRQPESPGPDARCTIENTWEIISNITERCLHQLEKNKRLAITHLGMIFMTLR